MYPEDESEFGKAVSSASYINDVNDDPVVIVDGLTKVGILHHCQIVAIIDVSERRTGVFLAGVFAGS